MPGERRAVRDRVPGRGGKRPPDRLHGAGHRGAGAVRGWADERRGRRRAALQGPGALRAGDFPAGEVVPIEASDGPEQEDPEAARVAREAFVELVSGFRASRRKPASWKPRTPTGSRRGWSCRRRPSRRSWSCARSPIGCGCWAKRCAPCHRARPVARDRRAREDERQGRRPVAAD